jgi:hypothetical protein
MNEIDIDTAAREHRAETTPSRTADRRPRAARPPKETAAERRRRDEEEDHWRG